MKEKAMYAYAVIKTLAGIAYWTIAVTGVVLVAVPVWLAEKHKERRKI